MRTGICILIRYKINKPLKIVAYLISQKKLKYPDLQLSMHFLQ